MTLPRASGPCLGGKGAASTDKEKWEASHGPAPQQCQLNRCPRGLSGPAAKSGCSRGKGTGESSLPALPIGTILSRTSLPHPVWFSHLILLCSPRGQSQLSQCRQEAKQGRLCTREGHTHSPAPGSPDRLPRASVNSEPPFLYGAGSPRTACKPLHPPPPQTENLGTVRSGIRKDSWPTSREPCGWCFLSDVTINLR